MQLTKEQMEGAPSKRQSWEGNVIVPLTQNILGGAAVAGLVWLFCIAFQIGTDVWFWSILTGSITTCLFTVIRFFADDVGLLAAAWKLGAMSQDGEIHRLNRIIHQLQNSQPSTAAAPPSNRNQFLDSMEWSHKHAQIMLKVKAGGGGITRRDCESVGIGQKAWARARQLMIDSKVYDGQTDQILIKSLSDAKAQLNAHYKPHFDRAQSNDGYRPSWMV